MTQDTSGAEVPAYTDVLNVPCLFGNPSGSRTIVGGTVVIQRVPTVLLPSWATVTEKCLIVGTYAPGFEKSWTPITPIVPATGREGFSHYSVQLQAVT